MKALWNALSVIAVANMIGLGLLVGWLFSSGRLDTDRAREIRALVSVTLADHKAALDLAASDAAAQEAERLEAEKAAKPPVTAAERLAARLEATELDRERAERLKREIADLQRGLSTERSRLDTEWTKLRTAQQAHADEVRRNEDTVGGAQFKKTLGVLGKLEPKDAKSILVQILNGVAEADAVGAGTSAVIANASAGTSAANPGRSQVLSYLDAMPDKTRTAILAEIVKDDPRLAAELLEGLRIRGTFAAVSAAR